MSDFAGRYGLKYLSIDSLGMKPADNWFWNQDHLRPTVAAEVWPKVAAACFD